MDIMIKKIFLMFISVTMLSGCASILSGRLQDVRVSTKPEDKASCLLMNDKGEWYVDYTPNVVQINSSYQDLEIICKKDGYLEGRQTVVSSAKGVMFLSVIFGGLLVDGLNGAGFAYPEGIDVELKPLNKEAAFEVPYE